MTLEVLATALFIFVARVIDVSLGTLRTVSVVRGKRKLAFVFGFAEVLVWTVVVAQVITNLDRAAYVVAFALGFATGTTVGISLERWFAMGEQVIRVFTPLGPAVASTLRQRGFRVTEFLGTGRDGKVSLLFIQIPRRQANMVASIAREVDPTCYYTVEDVRRASLAQRTTVSQDHLG
jgi:uncharacterized protein YebE (UPF0316 family)